MTCEASRGGLRLALAQTCFTPASASQGIAEMARLAREAAQGGADLLMLPETFLCGYGSAERMRGLSFSQRDVALAELGEVACAHEITILTGYSERAGPDLFNAAALVSAKGELLLNYRKTHLWGDLERAVFTPGRPAEPVEIAPGLRAGVLICYDLDFPEAARDLADRGADIVLVISATTAAYRVVPKHLVAARAYENGVFLAFCNHAFGPSADFAGGSRVAAPDGSIIATARGVEPEMIFADVDSQAFAGYRAAHPYRLDRRADLFASGTATIPAAQKL